MHSSIRHYSPELREVEGKIVSKMREAGQAKGITGDIRIYIHKLGVHLHLGPFLDFSVYHQGRNLDDLNDAGVTHTRQAILTHISRAISTFEDSPVYTDPELGGYILHAPELTSAASEFNNLLTGNKNQLGLYEKLDSYRIAQVHFIDESTRQEYVVNSVPGSTIKIYKGINGAWQALDLNESTKIREEVFHILRELTEADFDLTKLSRLNDIYNSYEHRLEVRGPDTQDINLESMRVPGITRNQAEQAGLLPSDTEDQPLTIFGVPIDDGNSTFHSIPSPVARREPTHAVAKGNDTMISVMRPFVIQDTRGKEVDEEEGLMRVPSFGDEGSSAGIPITKPVPPISRSDQRGGTTGTVQMIAIQSKIKR